MPLLSDGIAHEPAYPQRIRSGAAFWATPAGHRLPASGIIAITFVA